ncbi:MAG: helix-turn-helix transcriptional regulator [Lachnospiraceae bacterium]|nr:helix-turn-helix transcriptional regulator [Lachnospiraceae bacterium]
MDKPIAEIKERLRVALDFNNMTAQELSEKTGISKSSISQYLSGYAKPKGDRIYTICKVLHINETWLLGYDFPMKKTESSQDMFFERIEPNFICSHQSLQRIERYAQKISNLLTHGKVIIDVFDSEDRDKLIDYAEELKQRQRSEHFKDVNTAKAFLEGRQMLAALQLNNLEDSDYIAMANMIYKNDTKEE